jgi:transposase InsO family protein
VPAVGAVERDAAIQHDPARRGRWGDASDRRVGEPVWPLRLSQDHGGVAAAGWNVGRDRVQRIWRREGLKVPAKQKPRGRLWLNDGSCVRLRPEHANHVWSYDFDSAFTHDGRTLRLMTLIDEYSRRCLALRCSDKFLPPGTAPKAPINCFL